jgi:hypothetical protein
MSYSKTIINYKGQVGVSEEVHVSFLNLEPLNHPLDGFGIDVVPKPIFTDNE